MINIVSACILAIATVSAFAQTSAKPDLAAPYVATPSSIVDQMLQLAGTGPGDYVVDLGSGDGRLVITAVAKYNARGGFGVDIDPALVRLANDNAVKANVAERARFAEQDLFVANVADATVVTVYLLPGAMARVERKLLAELKPGTRVVAHDFQFPTWQPEKIVELESLDKLAATGMTFTRLFLYRVPAKN